MAKKKQEVELDDYEENEDGEYAEGDADDEYDDEYDEEGDDEEGKKGSGMAGVLVLILVGLVVAGGGAYYWMSNGSIPVLSSLPLSFLHRATPEPLRSGELSSKQFQNSQLKHSPAGRIASGSEAASDETATVPAGTKLAAAIPTAHKVAVAGAAAAVAAGAAHHAVAVHAAQAPAPAHEAARVSKTSTHARPTAATRVARRVHPGSRAHVWHGRHAYRHAHRHWRHHRFYSGRGGSWAVQVGAFSQADNAQRLIASLETRGYAAYNGSGAGVTGGRFSVYSNTVDTHAKADKLAGQFKAAGSQPRVVRLGGHYAVALGSFATEEAASSLVSHLNAKGLFATVSGHAGSSSGSHGLNRVMVGHYADRAAAEAAASRLRSQVGAATVVRR